MLTDPYSPILSLHTNDSFLVPALVGNYTSQLSCPLKMSVSNDQYTELSTKLHALATDHAATPEECLCLKKAAQAFAFIFDNGKWSEFEDYLRDFDAELSEEQKLHLRSMGINP